MPSSTSAAKPTPNRNARRRTRFGLQSQLIIPYVALTLVLALLGVYVVTQLVAANEQERFDNRLYEASRVAADGIVAGEQNLLDDLRPIVAKAGLASDLLSRDTAQLGNDLCPLMLNGQVDILTALDVTGHEILTLTPEADSQTCQRRENDLDLSAYALVSQILAQRTDGQGDKYAQILPIASGFALFISVPVREVGGTLTGVLLIGTPLTRLLETIKQETAVADLVILDPNGKSLASTLGFVESPAVLELSPAQVTALSQQADSSLRVNQRINQRPFVALFSPLVVRQQPIGALGVLMNSDYVVAAQTTSRDAFAGLFLLGTLAVILTGYILSQSIIRPIQRLRGASQEVAAGNLTARSQVQRTDEIGELAEAFDRMTERLQERTLETQQLYDEAQQRNRALAESNARLQTAQQQLIQSEKLAAIGQLTAGIVHDVKNPLTVIIGVSELLRDDPVLQQKAAEELQLIHDSANRANRIVSELLTFARQSTPEMHEQDLRATIETATRLNGYLARQARVKMTADLPPTAVTITYDAQQIEQVLVNLIHNAIQAMPNGGTLQVGLRTEHGGATITVQDTGVGIPPENLNRVFDPFFTTKPAGTGTGLGLSVTYGIVTRHHGHISVDSVVGQGTTFTLWLPSDQQPGPGPSGETPA